MPIFIFILGAFMFEVLPNPFYLFHLQIFNLLGWPRCKNLRSLLFFILFLKFDLFAGFYIYSGLLSVTQCHTHSNVALRDRGNSRTGIVFTSR